jgi:succinate dehydrogenase / fumarate reductase cytochrome b subunit
MASAPKSRVERPLSPFMFPTHYKPQITSVMSILHRATGCALGIGTLLLAWWLVAAASGPAAYAQVHGFLGSILGRLILLGFTWALFYHLCNGIRHLFWDVGKGFELATVTKSGIAVLVASAALTLLAWVLAYSMRGM